MWRHVRVLVHSNFIRSTSFVLFSDLEPIPPGEELSSLSESFIKPKLDAYKELPIIGLEYLVEISGSRHDDPVFKCLLCDTTLNEETVISDVTSTDHRLAYLVTPTPLILRRKNLNIRPVTTH